MAQMNRIEHLFLNHTETCTFCQGANGTFVLFDAWNFAKENSQARKPYRSRRLLHENPQRLLKGIYE
jgi:hypothetical protein